MERLGIQIKGELQMYLFYLKRLGHFKYFALINPIVFIQFHPIVFNITENTKEVYCQTQ